MEGDIRFNWEAIVEEAIKRRKASHLTQSQVAVLANVSKPTVIRFEKKETSIRLQSAIAILKLFGLFEK